MLHQQALVVVYMSYFVRQIFLWGCSFPHDSVHFVRQLPFQNPKHPVSSASTQCNIQPKTQYFCQAERLIIDLKQKPWWLLYMYTSGEGRSLVLQVWHRQTTSLWCLTGARSWGFRDPQRGHWTGYHALWSHTLSPADREDACLLSQTPLLTSTSYCHLVSWGSCHGERSPPPHHRQHCINTYNSFYTHY